MAAHVSAVLALFGSASGFAQQADIGIQPVHLTENEYVFDTAEQHKIRVVVLARGLKEPFAVRILPSGDALLAERSGSLRLVRGATGEANKAALDPEPIAGLPVLDPYYDGGGLEDVILDPQFASNGLLYMTFNKPGKAPDPKVNPPAFWLSRLTLLRAKLSNRKLVDVKELFVGGLGCSCGSRAAFGKDGMIYMTTGGPTGDEAQRLDNAYGKVLRLTPDGKVPADNPFVGRPGVMPEIFSYGHRDQFGLAVHPQTGALLNAEHGPNGGDEVNLVLPGRNYGWPKTTFGRNYDGSRVADSPVADGTERPLVVWLPSIAPTSLTVYNGDRFPQWRGNLFLSSARRGEINRTGGVERVVLNDKMEEIRHEILLMELHQRVHFLTEGPDGLLYALLNDRDAERGKGGALVRIEPAP